MRLGPEGTAVEFAADGRDLILLGDCLSTARAIGAGSIALAYLDPPFGTLRAQRYPPVFDGREAPYPDGDAPDSWWKEWEPRIDAILRALRAGGILALHLDPRVAPRARLALDERLGARHFLNEIIWHYRSGGIPRDRFAAKHDTLLVYRNGAGHTFHRRTEKRYLAHRMMRAGVAEERDARGWFREASIDDVWTIAHIAPDARERLGYPTQKPEALIERLLLAFTEEGETVADLVCGSGTLAAVARRLGRRWISGDRDPRAIVCSAGRIARLIAPSLRDAWDRAGVTARRGDLASRLERWRERPAEWGLSVEEREALLGASAPGFRIEWEDDSA